MSRSRTLLLTVLLVVSLSACGEQEAGRFSGTLITQGEHVIQAGEFLEGVILLTGGNLHLDDEAQVRGAIYVLDGSLVVEGDVEGDISILGGRLSLAPGAEIGGTLNIGGGVVEQAPGATVGEVVESDFETILNLDLARAGPTLAEQVRDFLLQAVALSLLAALAARFLPQPLARVGQAMREYPVAASAYGLLVGIVAPALLVVMAFTLVLIPLSTLGLLFLTVAALYGILGLSLLVGRYLASRVQKELATPVQAVAGAWIVMAFIFMVQYVPLLGGLIPLLLAATGLGATLLTRFGSRHFIPATDQVLAETEAPRASVAVGSG
jgi:hypothetical protein